MASVMPHSTENQVRVSATRLLINNRWVASESGKTFCDRQSLHWRRDLPDRGSRCRRRRQGRACRARRHSSRGRGGRCRPPSADVSSIVSPT